MRNGTDRMDWLEVVGAVTAGDAGFELSPGRVNGLWSGRNRLIAASNGLELRKKCTFIINIESNKTLNTSLNRLQAALLLPRASAGAMPQFRHDTQSPTVAGSRRAEHRLGAKFPSHDSNRSPVFARKSHGCRLARRRRAALSSGTSFRADVGGAWLDGKIIRELYQFIIALCLSKQRKQRNKITSKTDLVNLNILWKQYDVIRCQH